MPLLCEVVEKGLRCEAEAYTTVFDPTSWDQVRKHICRAHFTRAYQRGEVFQFVPAKRHKLGVRQGRRKPSLAAAFQSDSTEAAAV